MQTLFCGDDSLIQDFKNFLPINEESGVIAISHSVLPDHDAFSISSIVSSDDPFYQPHVYTEVAATAPTTSAKEIPVALSLQTETPPLSTIESISSGLPTLNVTSIHTLTMCVKNINLLVSHFRRH
jgi:hypothetical protein